MMTAENPFCTLGDLLRGLRDRFAAELETPISPNAGEVLGMLAGMVTRCDHLMQAIDRLCRQDPVSATALARAFGDVAEPLSGEDI